MHWIVRSRIRAARLDAGFTLIELMITVAIVAILAAIAIPSYQDSVWKGKRGEAKAAILRTLQSEERWYTQNNQYATYAAGSSPNGALPNFSADNLANSRYAISVESSVQTNAQGTSCAANDATKCVRVVATVRGNADPKCGNKLSMDTTGLKQSAVVNSACWN